MILLSDCLEKLKKRESILKNTHLKIFESDFEDLQKLNSESLNLELEM